MNRKNNGIKIMIFLLLIIMLGGCVNSADGQLENKQSTEKGEQEVVETTLVPTTTEPTMQTEPITIGAWSLEDCQSSTGIFIAHEDGSFSKYNGGGYLDKNGAGYSEGMFLHNDIAEANPTIGKADKLVVFCDSDYHLSLLPVKWEVGTMAYSRDDGIKSYLRVLNYDKYGVDFFEYRNDGDTFERDIMYVNGILAKDYPFEIVGGEDGTPIGCGFPKGTDVKLGVVEGTTLNEETYTVNATYYYCKAKRDYAGASEEQHYLYPTPTAEGYAVIDVYDGWHNTEIPAGMYVMELRMGRSYIAYLLNWQN